MKKALLSLLLLLFVPFTAIAEQYERPMLDLDVPTGLEENQVYLEFGHKFFTSLHNYDKNDFFSLLNWGANIRIGVRYMSPVSGLEAMTSYTSFHREKMLGLAYTFKGERMGFNAKAEAQYINYQDYFGPPVKQNFFALVTVQSVPLIDDRAVFTLDAGYDGFNSRVGLGLGASVLIVKHFTVLAEYYPLLSKYSGNSIGCYGFGIKYDTSGHQFMIRFSNTQEIGARDMMLGAADNNIYAGFDIMRLISF